MKPDKVLQLVGMAQRAHQVASGEFMTETTVKSGKACMVLAAEDASANTKKQFQNMCEFYKVPFRIYGTKDNLGHAIGKEMRASLSVTNEGLAKEILSKIDGGSKEWQK